ncbi:TonB-dependent receptor [Sandarakinorhabdus rubra]|uniref:TonB-dependent receptor n=1 Tax=Sandarakinorhabdus rubra TaxID=2672568 RepID=UPI0013DB3236|nr:TonB-dependent receptor [Sandarakinorhabdus rubra]
MRNFWLAATALSSLIGNAALAQTAAATDESEEIIVTAQKRAQNLQDVPISIDVTNGAALAVRQTDNISKLSTVVPGFEYARSPSDSPGVTFRGIGTAAGNVAFDNSIGMFVDGAFMGNVRLYNAPVFDAQRVELIKGTQSTLLGKNTSLGGISIVNTQPGDRLEGRVELGGEVQNGGLLGDGAITVPVNDKISIRVAGRVTHDRGWLLNETTNQRVPTDTNWGVRGILKFTPDDQLTVLLSYQHTDQKRVGSANQITDLGLAGLGLGTGPSVGPVTYRSGVKQSFSSSPELRGGDDYLRTTIDMPIGTITYDFDGVELTSITSAAWFENIGNNDFDFNNKDFNLFLRSENYSQFSQELRLASTGDSKLNWIVGGFFFTSKWNMLQRSIWGIPDFPPGTPDEGQLFNGSYTNDFRQKTDAFSAFGSVTYEATDRLTVNLGLRYTHERKRVDFGRTAVAPFTLWNTFINAPFPFQRLDRATDDLLAGNISVQYKASEDVMLYAAASRGGKAGGYGEFQTVPFDPGVGAGNPNRDARIGNERANSYEAGVKATLFDNRLTLNAAAFWIDVFGLQQLQFTAAGLFVSSNDRARSRGVEGNWSWRLTDALTWSGGVTWADAEQLNPSLRLTQSPRFSGASRLDWRVPLKGDTALTFGGQVKHRSSKFNQLGEGLFTPSFTTLALNARVDAPEGFFLNISGENITNAKGADFGFAGPDPFVAIYETLAPRRTIRISLGKTF